MAKNKVQFQKGLSLTEFLSHYGTDKQCRNVLYSFRWPKGFRCPKCGNEKYCEIKKRDLFQCNKCHSQTSVTAGSIFAATKLPLTTWFLGIYFMTQSKVSISALSLSRILGVSANTALLMKHKLQQVMKLRDDHKPLTLFVQLDDAYWGGKKRDGVRGRGATGKTPFVAAVSTNKDGHPIAMRFSQVKAFTKDEIKTWAQMHLHPDCQIVTDGLNCFPALQEAGYTHNVVITGGGPESVKKPEFKWVNTIISNVKRALHGTFHSISKKHFSLYLAEFCYRLNRRYDLPQMIERFTYIAIRTPPAPQRIFTKAEFPW